MERRLSMDTWLEWRELTEDGLLKEPKEQGPYYDRDSLKNGYATEKEAVEDWEEFTKRHPFGTPREMVLLRFYRRPCSEA